MEEILASIRRIIEDSDTERAPRPTRPAAPEIAPAIDPEPEESGEIASFRAELAAPDVSPAPMAPTPDLAAALRDAVATRIEPPVFQTRPEPPALHMARPVDQPAPPPANDLLSVAPGRKVAAAFGELSEAFAAQRRRSFDEMAEDMLRPMLRDWLDENLPTMVERLVREEIERLARGERG